MMNEFGFSDSASAEILRILRERGSVKKAVIFGSRARNDFKVGSDVDLAVWLDGDGGELAGLKSDFEDSTSPYFFDVLDYEQIENEKLRREIDREGKLFYRKGWQETTLGEVAVIQTGKNIPTSKQLNSGQYEIVGANGKIGFTDNFLLDGEYILTGRVGTIGEINYRKGKFHPSDNVLFIQSNEKSDNKFLFYFLKTQNLKNLNVGSTQPLIKQSDLKKFLLLLPPLPEQRAIAAVLSSLDNKIELLRKQNQTLEAIAQNIFKRWFVEFKFPGCEKVKMVDSELGKIPEEWRVGRLGDEFKIVMGQSPSGKSYNEKGNGMIFFQGRAEFQERFPKTRLYTTEPKRVAEQFDVLVSVRAPVGDINVASEKCCIGRGLGAVRGRHKSYALYKIKSLKEVFDKFETEGTVFGSINKDSFLNIAVVIPKEEIFTQFESVTNPIDKKIFNNYLQIQTLSTLRDTLLPRLMRGEVKCLNLDSHDSRITLITRTKPRAEKFNLSKNEESSKSFNQENQGSDMRGEVKGF